MPPHCYAGAGLLLPQQFRRGSCDAAFEDDKRSVAFGMWHGLGKETAARGNDAAGEHKVVVQLEGLDGHSVGILGHSTQTCAHCPVTERCHTAKNGRASLV
jgi:hypothetical protein